MTKAANHNALGGQQPHLCLYLPNPPELWPGCHLATPDLKRLIALNGNHWRKILTIFAKLCVPNGASDKQWRDYRDHQLLQQGNERIEFNADRLVTSCRWHLVAGKVSWQRLGYDVSDFQCFDEGCGLFQKGHVLLLPYFDYRQFSNLAVDKVRALMQAD